MLACDVTNTCTSTPREHSSRAADESDPFPAGATPSAGTIPVDDDGDDDSSVACRLDEAERLGRDDKILDAARLLDGIDESRLRSVHRYILGEAAILSRLVEEAMSPVTASVDASPNGNENETENGGASRKNVWTKQGVHTGRHNFVIYYKVDESRLTCRIETPIDVTLLAPLLSVLNESELYHAWLPNWRFPRLRVTKSERLHQTGRCSQVVSVAAEVPWPMAEREAVLNAVPCDDIDTNGRIAVRIGSLDAGDEVVDMGSGGWRVPPAKKRTVRMRVRGGFVFQRCSPDHPALAPADPPESRKQPRRDDSPTRHRRGGTNNSSDDDRVLVTFTFYVDPNLPGLPMKFVNFFVRTAMGQMWSMFLDVAEDVRAGRRPEHGAAIAAKREGLYDWVEERAGVMIAKSKEAGPS